MNIIKAVLTFFAITFLAGCQIGAPAQKPQPAILGEDDIGHSDQMIVMNHVGPRAQVHLAGASEPLWFSSVRDGLVYLRSPEQTAKILAIYVNDIGVAESWENMGAGNWIDAEAAFYVVGSDAKGGMGAPEFVPFSDEEKAQAFADERGGEILGLDDITAEMVLAPVEQDHMAMPSMSGNNDATDMDMSPGGG